MLARWMGAAPLGVFVYATSLLWILGLVAALGLPLAAQRFLPQYWAAGDAAHVRGYVGTAFRIVLGFGIAVGAVTAAVAFFATGLDARSDNFLTLALASVAVPLAALWGLQLALARAHLWYFQASISGTFLRPFLFLLLVAAAWIADVHPTASFVMALLVVALLATVLCQFALLRRRLAPRWGTASPAHEIPLWLRTSVPLLVVVAFIGHFADVSVVFVGLFLAPPDVAIFNAALRTVGIITFGLVAVGAIVGPRASRLHAKEMVPVYSAWPIAPRS